MAKARILAVDDQRYFRELIAGMLAEEGFEAQTAASGEEALHILENADFDVVLTDLVMPGMDGSELVHRIKARRPDQSIIVVTGVVDVKTAVDAMKLGATDYLLKPFDRRTLTVTLESILQNSRLKAEHARLLAENIEYIGERSLYERAVGLFSALAVEPLAMRILDTLCLETRAQGAVIWIASDDAESDPLDLAAARGLVRLSDEQETLAVEGLPEDLQGGARSCLEAWGGGESEQPALYATLRREGRVAGLVRLTDKLEGEEFDALDTACVEKMLHFADVALANALKVRSLERRGLKEPGTGAYHFDYFRDVVRNEVEKASRFGRSLALLKLDLGSPRDLRRVGGEAEATAWLQGIGGVLRGMLRATDLLAVDDAWHFYMLLPEADALGATVLKRRAIDALASSEPFTRLEPADRPQPAAGLAIYPTDGERLEVLLQTLDERVAEARDSRVTQLGLDRLSLSASLQALVRQGEAQRSEIAQQITRFVLSEVGRHPREQGLLYLAPGAALAGAVREGLETLRDAKISTELIVIGEGDRAAVESPAVTWVPAEHAVGLPPCLVHYGDGPAYALIREEAPDGVEARLFHTDDRSLVEHLAFRLQEELAVPPKLRAEGP
jgi:DNA-binding response OmpR family regulator/GGDEF domain-containing protein